MDYDDHGGLKSLWTGVVPTTKMYEMSDEPAFFPESYAEYKCKTCEQTFIFATNRERICLNIHPYNCSRCFSEAIYFVRWIPTTG